MAKSQRKQTKPNKLRRLAEKRFNTKSAALANISVDNLDEALHELAVHQIELEMQNKELIRTQEELSNSRNNYLSLYDFAPIGYFTLDTRGQILEANLTGARFLGVERRSLLNKKFRNFIAKEDQDIFYFHTKDVFENEELQSCEIRVTRKDGVLFNAQLVSVAVNFQTDESAQHLLSIIDITERKRVEKKLRESEERFRGIFEQAAVGIAQNSPDGKFLRVNDRFCHILGYTQDELLNLTVPDITHSDDLEVERHEIRRLVALETDIHQMEKRFIHKDGREIWGRATVSLVRERSGQPKYFVGVLEDITKQKEAEKAVKEKDKSLEHQAQHLQEVNTALKVLIEHREKEKEELIDNLLMNLKKLVFPYLEKLDSRMENEQHMLKLSNPI